MAAADAVFIAVGTPSRRGDGHADLSYVYAAAKEIAGAIDGFTVVVTKSTVPVGTGDEVERIIREARPGIDVAVVSNPEFLREGAAIQDFKHPDRIVVGSEEERATKVMAELYRPLHLNRSPILVTGRRTAELTKYAANAFLATKITFINEIADLCERVGADVQDVARGIGLDNRIGGKFLHAGAGYGGSCFPKDTLALIKTGQDFEAPMRIVEKVAAVNETLDPALTLWLVGLVVTDGAKSTVIVAFVEVAEPLALVNTARNLVPFWPAATFGIVSVVEVAPATFWKVAPPSVLNCHCTVGVGLPDAAAVKFAVCPAFTV